MVDVLVEALEELSTPGILLLALLRCRNGHLPRLAQSRRRLAGCPAPPETEVHREVVVEGRPRVRQERHRDDLGEPGRDEVQREIAALLLGPVLAPGGESDVVGRGDLLGGERDRFHAAAALERSDALGSELEPQLGD